MGEKSWKASERKFARDMGVERQPVTGDRDASDFKTHPLFCFQVKVRKALPDWLFAWLGGICGVARPDGKVGVLVLKTPGMPHADALVVLRWADWVDLHGPQATVPLD